MKVIPFLISTTVCALCFVLSVLFFFKAGSNRSIKQELLTQQTSNQKLQQQVKEQDEEGARQSKVYQVTTGIAQLRQGELQRQQQIIEQGASVQQKIGPAIIRDIGFLAAKNNNEKIKALLRKQKWDAAIPSAEEVKKIEEQIRAQGAGGATPGAAPAAPRPATPAAPAAPTPR